MSNDSFRLIYILLALNSFVQVRGKTFFTTKEIQITYWCTWNLLPFVLFDAKLDTDQPVISCHFLLSWSSSNLSFWHVSVLLLDNSLLQNKVLFLSNLKSFKIYIWTRSDSPSLYIATVFSAKCRSLLYIVLCSETIFLFEYISIANFCFMHSKNLRRSKGKPLPGV